MRSTSRVRLPLTGCVPGVVGGEVRDARSVNETPVTVKHFNLATESLGFLTNEMLLYQKESCNADTVIVFQ